MPAQDLMARPMFGFTPVTLLLLLFALAFLVAMLQIGLFSLAFERLGLSPEGAMLMLFGSLGGSLINIPLFRIHGVARPLPGDPDAFPGERPHPGRYTRIAINVGGGVIPVLFSVHLMLRGAVEPGPLLAGVLLITLISFAFSRPIRGVGIAMPVLVAPLGAALTAVLLAPSNAAPLAYCCGTLGVLIGADLLRLRDVGRLGTPLASIGGAGTFDGIFLTGIVAVLLT